MDWCCRPRSLLKYMQREGVFARGDFLTMSVASLLAGCSSGSNVPAPPQGAGKSGQIVLINGRILAYSATGSLTVNSAVAVSNGTIAAVGSNSSVQGQFPNTPT